MKTSAKRDAKVTSFHLSAIAAAMATSFSGGVLAQQAAPAASNDDASKLDTVEVTGSRLKRAEIEGALPVSTIERSAIDTSGFTSVGELLRNTTFNSTGAFRAQSGSTAQGLVAVDLRGLGSERTLVLIDGRRAPKAPYAPTAQDLNAVPLAAVERIEILKDGASAIYGSDAIGGVINIITRKDFEGVELSYQEQGTDRKGGDIQTGYVTMGAAGAKGNIVIGASYYNRDIIFARDAILAERGASLFSNNLIYAQDTNGDGEIQGSEYVYAPVPGGCPNSDPAFYVTSVGRCGYDFNLVAADEAQTGNQGLFARGVYHINESWDFTGNFSINRATSFGRYAPSLNDIAVQVPVDNPFLDTSALTDAEGNPFDPDLLLTPLYLYHRFASLGNRDTSTDANVYDISGVVTGSIGAVNLDFGLRGNEYKYFEIGRNFVVLPLVQGVLDDGTYDFRDPQGSPDVAASLKHDTSRESTWRTREAFVTADFPLFPMAGGSAQLAVGAEYREEDYKDLFDALSSSGQVGGSSGNSAGIGRDVKALYAEALFPILSNLEVTAAIRRDDYSDYGSDTSPKIAVRYSPMDVLTLRASYGQGFRAPSLDLISAQPAFSAESITNDQGTCEFTGGFFDTTSNTCFDEEGGDVFPIQINSIQISNPDLASEKSDQYSIGFAWDVTPNFNFSLDYYNIQIEDRIDEMTPEEVLDAIRLGESVPPAFVVTRGATGRITNLVFGFANTGDLETSGLDLEANFNMALPGNLGNFKSMARVVHMLKFAEDGGRDEAGDPAVPEMRAMINNEWKVWDITAAWNINYIDSQFQTVTTNAQGDIIRTGHIPSYTTHDLQVAYHTPWNGEISAGVLNVFGKEPSPKSTFDGRDYNFYLYDQYGQQPYVRYTQRF